jgi:hypothetical protein
MAGPPTLTPAQALTNLTKIIKDAKSSEIPLPPEVRAWIDEVDFHNNYGCDFIRVRGQYSNASQLAISMQLVGSRS